MIRCVPADPCLLRPDVTDNARFLKCPQGAPPSTAQPDKDVGPIELHLRCTYALKIKRRHFRRPFVALVPHLAAAFPTRLPASWVAFTVLAVSCPMPRIVLPQDDNATVAKATANTVVIALLMIPSPVFTSSR